MFSDLAFLKVLDVGRLDVKFRYIILYTVPPGEFGNKVLNIGLFLGLPHICSSYLYRTVDELS